MAKAPPGAAARPPFAALVRAEPGEGVPLALSAAYFTLLLASYYAVRPLRDALAAGLASAQIKYLSLAACATMFAIVPAFGWLVARVPRRTLVPAIHAFFVADLLAFAALFRAFPEAPALARTFYVWVAVFNMLAVALFWSVMAEIWREAQARRLFGAIAAGGSLGGLLGPWLTRTLVADVGVAGVALLAAALLAGALATSAALERRLVGAGAGRVALDEPVGGAILAGLTRLVRSPFLLGVAGLVVIGSLLGMFVYIEMARLAGRAYPDAATRTAFYSARDLAVNGLALAGQLLLVGRLTTRFGVRTTLVGVALLSVAAFVALGLAPTLTTLVAVNVVQRAAEFGLGKPARDMLYTVVDRETKYKVKNVVDTALTRGSDTASGWVHGAFAAVGVGLPGIAWLSTAIAGLLVAIAWRVGTGYRRRGGL